MRLFTDLKNFSVKFDYVHKILFVAVFVLAFISTFLLMIVISPASNTPNSTSVSKVSNINNDLKDYPEEARNIIIGFTELFNTSKPTLATITNIDEIRLKNPESELFYKGAMNGDRLIIFTDFNIAYIYRPSEKRILNVSTIENNPSTPSKKVL